jgi:hypothetical protein
VDCRAIGKGHSIAHPNGRQAMWSTREELEDALRQAGLGLWAPRLAAISRCAVILEPGPVEEATEAPIGASRLGGMPDLPPEVSWPWRPALTDGGVFKDHAARPWPLSFVAHVDFEELLRLKELGQRSYQEFSRIREKPCRLLIGSSLRL